MKLSNIHFEYHRNGICGNPFWVSTFHDDDENLNMVAVIFSGECRCAVFDIDKLSKGNIAFGSNSWRGDWYYNDLQKHLKAHKIAQYGDDYGD